MILEQLKLKNFCLYGGEQSFDLTPTRRRGRHAPIVLFGGINGGGKTTLLDAVQLVLYGTRASCSKRAEKPYDQFLEDSIHRGADPEDGASIKLSFRYGSGGEDHLFAVTRAWSVVRGRVRETVRVTKDGKRDGWLSDNWSQLVEELIPSGISQLFFFDAEKVRFLAEDESSTRTLGDAIKGLLGLDLAERLIADASVIEGRIAKRTRASVDRVEIERLEQELEAKEAELRRLKQNRAQCENERLAGQNRLEQAERAFAEAGGQHWEERESRRRELAEVRQSLSEIEQQLVGLAACELPLALLSDDLLPAVARQMDREQQVSKDLAIQESLEQRDAALIDFLEEQKAAQRVRKQILHFLEADRASRMSAGSVESYLHLSETARSQLSHLLQHGLADRMSVSRGLCRRLDELRERKTNLDRADAATPKEASVKDVAAALKSAAQELANSGAHANRLDQEIDRAEFGCSELTKHLQRLRRKVVDEGIDAEQDQRLARLAVRTQTTMREFLRQATEKKIDRLSGLVTESFRFLLRKKSLVDHVLIDPHTFEITLLGADGEVVPKQRLSEGEKQIFAVSVLWGLSRASARPLPAIIDTPMARLDAEHRNQLVERYFPHASHQVIVLSTDTEVDQQYFHELQPHIARSYHLKYDEDEQVTNAVEGYFWEVPEPEELQEALT
jgi:DNA sulfur modification protein DndD